MKIKTQRNNIYKLQQSTGGNDSFENLIKQIVVNGKKQRFKPHYQPTNPLYNNNMNPFARGREQQGTFIIIITTI